VSTPDERLSSIRKYVESRPEEAFPRYGLAMEYAKAGQLDEAHSQFEELRRRHPDYVATYYHHGMLLIKMGRKEDARRTWEEGIQICTRKGDLHTRGEIEAALMELGSVSPP
jgi:predicted Zn-dependent protease